MVLFMAKVNGFQDGTICDIVNNFQLLAFFAESSILDFMVVIDMPRQQAL